MSNLNKIREYTWNSDRDHHSCNLEPKEEGAWTQNERQRGERQREGKKSRERMNGVLSSSCCAPLPSPFHHHNQHLKSGKPALEERSPGTLIPSCHCTPAWCSSSSSDRGPPREKSNREQNEYEVAQHRHPPSAKVLREWKRSKKGKQEKRESKMIPVTAWRQKDKTAAQWQQKG